MTKSDEEEKEKRKREIYSRGSKEEKKIRTKTLKSTRTKIKT